MSYLYNFCLYCLFSVVFNSAILAQENAKIKIIDNHFSFLLNRNLNESQQLRFEERFAIEFPSIEQIDFTENSMSFIFKKEILMEAEKTSILLKIIQRFGYSNYELITE